VARSLTSGDIIADRRFAWAQASKNEGDIASALDLMRATVDLVPTWPPAWFELGTYYAALGQTEDAISAFQSYLRLDHEDVMGAALHIAHLTQSTPEKAPHAYVRALFDDYAPRFDEHLITHLHYKVPDLMRQYLERFSQNESIKLPLRHVLDLGCGTGLVAKALQGLCERIDGVDLSPAMIERARSTGLYTAVITADGLASLDHYSTGDLDAIIAADVFVYIGRIDDYIRKASDLLREGGLIMFSVQETEGASFKLSSDLRYAHSCAYIEELAQSSHFKVLALDPITPRYDEGKPIAGRLALLCRIN
jgi:predicted TPR repeat methyltransferase